MFAQKAKKSSIVSTSSNIILNIKTDFGAKGDGITNDHLAFENASIKINKLKNNVTLIIPNGKYIVGKQLSKKNTSDIIVFNILDLDSCTNIKIIGGVHTIIQFKGGFRFGSFDPVSLLKTSPSNNFYKPEYRNDIGDIIYLKYCKNVEIRNLELDGNINNMEIGGAWGDTGFQLLHDGIILFNCEKVIVQKVNVHHFGKDGIMIGNKDKEVRNNQIEIQNSKFEYNGRQGLSWIGGSGLLVRNCSFSNTGRNGVVKSMPGAGVDIESEWAPINKGLFIKCKIENNYGCGFLADSGPSSDITMDSCIVTAPTMWSIWITKPNYTIKNTIICGSIVHGFNATNMMDATKYINCSFTDLYKGINGYGRFLIEVNGIRRINFNRCKFNAVNKKLMWVEGCTTCPKEEMPTFSKCDFTIGSIAKLPQNDYLFVGRGSHFSYCNFYVKEKKSKMRGIFFQCAGGIFNEDNKVVYINEKAR
jgi:hypothetical protein